ncbi:MAG: paraslipin [Leptospiraceae bacterium]|nr:paraslipin [Leptospiraceae bacterium]MCP5495408.1 paraslipin [Leptospiraceae bacterium]
MDGILILITILLVLAIVIIVKTFIVVPQQYAYIKERFGKYQGTLNSGFYFLIPFVDKIHYKHNLKEITYDVDPQECITRDNVSVEIDGILYLKVIEPKKASYGIDHYLNASIQLAKTTLRSEIGKLNLDDTFAERESINSHVVNQLDSATDPWGIKITRYEIKNISPPKQVLSSMEQQMKAEREKRAEITISEGEKISRINRSLGDKKEAINISEGDKIRLINEAEGKAAEIEMVSTATANGLKMVSNAISKDGGYEAVDLRVAQSYLESVGKILASSKTSVLPLQVANVLSVFEGFSKVTSSTKDSLKMGDKK